MGSSRLWPNVNVKPLTGELEAPDLEALLHQARAAREQGRFGEARQHFEALLTETLTPTMEADARSGLAGVLHVSGLSVEALAQLHLALALREQLGDTHGAAGIQMNLGILFGDLGNHALALEHYEQARALLHEGSDPARVVMLHNNLGRAHIEHGDLERGEQVIREGLALVTADTPVRLRSLLELNLAEALRRSGKLDEAASQYLAVIKQAVTHRMPDLQQRAIHGQALVQIAQGEHVRARELLFEALRLARRTGDLDAELLAMTGLAEVSLTAGQFDVALMDAELVLVRAAEGQRLRFVREGHDLMARACEGLGDYQRAYEQTVQARDVERRLHAGEVEQHTKVLAVQHNLQRLPVKRDNETPAQDALNANDAR